MGSLREATSKVIESTGHTVKDSTTGVGILGGIGRHFARWLNEISLRHCAQKKICSQEANSLAEWLFVVQKHIYKRFIAQGHTP